MWVIVRKTWGWHKKMDRISLGQLSKLTQIPRKKTFMLIKQLENKKVIVKSVPKKGDSKFVCYGVQKDYDKWVGVPKKEGIPKKGDRVSPKKGTKVSPKKGTTIDTLKDTNKDTNTKDIDSDNYKKVDENVSKMDTQVSIDKVSIGKDRLGKSKVSIDNTNVSKTPSRTNNKKLKNESLTVKTPLKDIEQSKKPLCDTNKVFNFFCNKYKEVFGKEYVANFGKDKKIIKDLLRIIPSDELEYLISLYFVTPDEYSEKAGYSVGMFKTKINSLRIEKRTLRFSEKTLKSIMVGKAWLKKKEKEDVR